MDLQTIMTNLQQAIHDLEEANKKMVAAIERAQTSMSAARAANEARQTELDSEIKQIEQSMDEETLKLIQDLQLGE